MRNHLAFDSRVPSGPRVKNKIIIKEREINISFKAGSDGILGRKKDEISQYSAP